MSQIIDEFDQPSPATVSFCHKISSEDFDLHSAQTTKDALHELMNHLEERPEEFYQILRRRKADSLKMFQFLKVKVLNKFKDQYLEKYFPDDLCKEELDKMKKEMASAFDYAQGKFLTYFFCDQLSTVPRHERSQSKPIMWAKL